MKTINYRGMTFEVEDHFKYLAEDPDGDVRIYENKPTPSYDGWMVNKGDYKKLTTVENWEDSLENI